MNTHIQRLFEIAQKPKRTIIGLMSGTSLDGLDIALCQYQGNGLDTKVEILAFETISYEETVKDEIRKIFARKTIDFQHLCLLNPWIGNLHADLINGFLKARNIAPKDVDCIASHGQTVFHAPKILHDLEGFPNATLQIGDGDHIAQKTGIITFSDFRQKHCAAGGEGAPLAVYGDYLIFSKKDTDRILLNMGGISNFTYLPGNLDPNLVFATDTGPGNTMIDKFVQVHFGIPYDKDGALSMKGTISYDLLNALKEEQYFSLPVPKTTGPELFNLDYLSKAQKGSNTENLKPEDVIATLSRFSAETISECILSNVEISGHTEILISGGGAHNPAIVGHIKSLLPDIPIGNTTDVGIEGDAKEAVLFATLANEALVGGKVDFGARKGVPSVSMGKISFPG
ncbi:MAG: anhydro-N-acetylmuramic acid kinase [Leadbetterella sp.]